MPSTPEATRKVDPSSPEYKRASKKYTSLMVALPILLVTSYFLFDRCKSMLASCLLAQ
jgi:hypothetical protein